MRSDINQMCIQDTHGSQGLLMAITISPNGEMCLSQPLKPNMRCFTFKKKSIDSELRLRCLKGLTKLHNIETKRKSDTLTSTTFTTERKLKFATIRSSMKTWELNMRLVIELKRKLDIIQFTTWSTKLWFQLKHEKSLSLLTKLRTGMKRLSLTIMCSKQGRDRFQLKDRK